jgi:hypothetical protein
VPFLAQVFLAASVLRGPEGEVREVVERVAVSAVAPVDDGGDLALIGGQVVAAEVEAPSTTPRGV